MLRFSLPSLIKFLIGIFLLQAVTVLLVYTAERTNLAETWWLFLSLGLAIGALVAFWFTSLAEGNRHKAESQLKERHFREREAIRVKAEKERAEALKTTAQLVAKARARAASGNMLKTGAIVSGGVGVALLMMTQFITVGLLALTTAGGLMLGYGVRARQDRWAREHLLGAGEKHVDVLTYAPQASLAVLPMPKRRKKKVQDRGRVIEGPGASGEPIRP